ncbi:MAG: AAA family ATPase, partial [Eggerthellaceae bacterium]|nr:AAA family ATPase [Eggerthellaceae bacterium]
PDVFNILLQILEEGRLTDAQGRTVDFRNTIIIMTSNVGAREISETTPLGFGGSGEKRGLSDAEIKSRVMSEVKKLFRPEFLNRIDEIIVFKSLTEEQIIEIVKLMIADLRERLIAQNMTINMTDEACKYIAKEGTDVAFGARPLRRAIQRLIEDPLSEQILGGRWEEGSVIEVDYKDGALTFEQGSGVIPQPRKRDTIAREAELLLTNFDLNHAGSSGSAGGGDAAGASD